MTKRLLIVFLLVCTFQACAQKSYEEQMQNLLEGTVPVMKAQKLDSLKKSGTNIVLLDARRPNEYKVSHIEGARFIDYDDFKKSDVNDIPKDAAVVVYCTAGYRSERIGEKLQKMGYSNVSNLFGGLLDWKNNKFEVVNNQEQPTDSVHTYNKAWSKWLFDGIKVYD